jgi:alpha-beta hydrolase superfamily lysophospholipase
MPRHWIRRSLATGLALIAAFLAFQAFRGARAEARVFSPDRGLIHVPPVLEGVPLQEVAFGAAPPNSRIAAEIRAWYVPSRSGAAVVLAHGSNADRSELATEARLLADDGFGVLAFDWPGHGESTGKVTYGPLEKSALRAAVSFVASQPYVDASRIGALGFSVGGALVAVTAEEEPLLRAIAIISCFADSDEQTRNQFGRWRAIMEWPAVWVDRWYMPEGPLRPVDALRHLTGKELLVVSATEDNVVPSWMSAKVYAAAGGRKEWLLVPHSGHGGFDALAPGPYRDSILRFFRRTLKPA